MKVVLLAGGAGTRISEESVYRPKPMVEIGGMPILWHIMKTYAHYGFNEFVVCAGYKQHMIKDWFAGRYLHSSDVTFDFTGGGNAMTVHRSECEPWKVTIADTGLSTMTGGRIARIREQAPQSPIIAGPSLSRQTQVFFDSDPPAISKIRTSLMARIAGPSLRE